MCLHTFPHLDRPTLNDLKPHQHEKTSLVYVREQSPPGLALVPCALSAVDKRGRNKRLNHTHSDTHTCRETKNKVPSYSRTVRYVEDFFLRKPRRNGSRFALARLNILPTGVELTGNISYVGQSTIYIIYCCRSSRSSIYRCARAGIIHIPCGKHCAQELCRTDPTWQTCSVLDFAGIYL